MISLLIFKYGYVEIKKDFFVRIIFFQQDIAGEERFGAITPLFYRDAAGCLIVFDVSKPTTLVNGAVKWRNDFDDKVNFDENNQIPCLLVGNKVNIFLKNKIK